MHLKKILFMSVFFLAGCSTISYQNSNGEKVSYSRLGSQNLSGLTIAKNGESVAVKIESQRTSTEEIANAVTKIADTAKTLVTKGNE
jgi:hypothetical protein